MLQVGQLDEHLAKRKEGTIYENTGDLTVNDDATLLYTGTGMSKSGWLMDEVATGALTKYLKVPTNWYNKLTPEFRATVLRYEFNRHKEVGTVLETLDDEVVAVHSVDQVMLPLGKVAKVVEKVFKPEDTIRRIITDGRFHLDVTTGDHTLSLPGHAGGLEVGDLTEAGVRFLSHPFKNEAPSVNAYIERLVCKNGQTTPQSLGKISLKGKSVDEVINSMEEAANLVLADLDDHLAKVQESRKILVPGNTVAFCAQLAKEAGVTRQVLDAVLAIVNQLAEPITVWQVQDAFTEVANKTDKYATMVKLQTLGGSLSFNTQEMLDRCGTCERLL